MIEIIHELRKTNSKNKKEAILRKHKDNTTWKNYLLAVYDEQINYFIKSIPDGTFHSADEYSDMEFEGLFLGLAMLANRDITGNKARDFAIELSIEYGELFRLVLGRSLKAGITATTINKAYPGLIPQFKVMLGKDEPIKRFPVYCSLKFDGIRLVAEVRNKVVTIRTRAGKLFPLTSLQRSMALLPEGYYDGEIIASSGRMQDRTLISGQANKIIRGTSNVIKDYKFMIFDRLSLADWDAQDCTAPFHMRYKYLLDTVPESALVQVVEQDIVHTQEAINDIFELYIELGYEGIITREAEDPYVWKRSSMLNKKKSIKECILTCVDIQMGEGKYAGMIGALICEGIVEGREVRVKLGSGLTDHDRDMEPEFFEKAEVEAHYNGVIKPENSDEWSLFLPRFKRIVGDLDT